MRLNLTLILTIVLISGLIAISYTVYQSKREKDNLKYALEVRTRLIAEELILHQILSGENNSASELISFTDSISRYYQAAGFALYFAPDSILYPPEIEPWLVHSTDYVLKATIADTSIGNYFNTKTKHIYQHILPFQKNGVSNQALVIYMDATYIDSTIRGIWFRNVQRWFLQSFFICIVIFLILRLAIFNPVRKIIHRARDARTGRMDQLAKHPPARFLAPLQEEIYNLAMAMQDAKASAEVEARLRSQKDFTWTADQLKVETDNLLLGKKLVVVSNREPYMHIREGNEIKCIIPASGMITAMEPILKACGGLWIAHGSGDADKEMVDQADKLVVPPQNPRYVLRRIWLSPEEEKHYYYGFSNEGLWPLCHIAHTRPVFRKEDWDYYKLVNQRFADAVLEETKGDEQPYILIQDYHFALLPALIKNEKPNAKVTIFWHIPWPNPESFGICPWQREILQGMLGADLIGFHTQYHCNHFLDTANAALESRVTWDQFSVKIKGHTSYVKPFPISIDFTAKDFELYTQNGKTDKLLQNHGLAANYIGVGVDRIDYTKGIVEKFQAVERFLEKNPAYLNQFTFIQIGAPSRAQLKSYSDMIQAVEQEADRINKRLQTKNWKPILLLKRHHSHEEILPFYASANFCMVTSLHDGMNLVAKEYIATRSDNDGALILSRFAGAAQQLQGAIIINPYDIEKSADAIQLALEMPEDEKINRMRMMRQSLVSNNIYFWAYSLLKEMAAV